MYVALGDTFEVLFGTEAADGTAVDADALPVVTVLAPSGALAYAPTVTHVATGLYRVDFAASYVNGFRTGTAYSAFVAFAVASSTGRDGIASFNIARSLDDTAAPYARMLGALLPPGRAWRLIGGSILSKVLVACADELGRIELRTKSLLDEADPRTTIEMLPEYESELGLESTGTDAERQARIVARLIARQRFRPVDFQTALAGLLGQDASAVVVIERTHAFADSIGDDREIFHFFIYRDPAAPGAYYLASAQALVDQIKPSHTIGTVIESTSMLYDDPHSLYDRDLLGA